MSPAQRGRTMGEIRMAKAEMQISLFDYFPNMFEVPSELKTISEKATEESGAGRKAYSYDVGEELVGARKHLASLLKFSPEWYTALEQDPSQAFAAICKDELLGAFPVDECREKGCSSEVAYAIKLIWDRVCQRPEDKPTLREQYMRGITELKMVFEETYSQEQFKKAFEALREDIKKATWSQSDRLVQKDPSVIEYAFWLSLGERFKRTFLSGGRGKGAGYVKIFAKAFTSDEGQDWLWTGPKTRATTQSQSKERWERRVPSEVIRLSIAPSGVEKPEDLMEHYGYRGIQFGNWMEDAAGRYHVLCSGNAHADLAAILDLPRSVISFYGALGLAFGARGTGKASAHYEPHLNIINLTKMNGGGSLCHEWAHALDYNLNSYSHDFANGLKAPLSGSDAGARLPQSIKSAFTRLMVRIKQGNGVLRQSVPNELPSLRGRYRSDIGKRLERADYDVTNAVASLKGVYRIKSNKQWIEIGMYYCHLLKEAGREVPTEFFIPTDFSAFFLDAKERGEYWRRDHELFARAFEAWIEDELVDRKMTNSYLVSGTRCEGPYPQGDERIAINGAFREWWRTLLESRNFTGSAEME